MAKAKEAPDGNPREGCERKCPLNNLGCTVWRAWWLRRWALIYEYGRRHIK